MKVRLRVAACARCEWRANRTVVGRGWRALLFGVLALSPGHARAAAPYGMAVREPIAPFLNHRLPPAAPDAASGWTIVPAFPNLTFRDPIFFVAEPGLNRVCVGSLWGTIYRFVNDPATTSPTVFLDISAHTKAVIEGSGLLNMAFHPEFGRAGSPNRGFIYVYYEYSPDPADAGSPFFNRLSRFTVPDGAEAADPNSELVLINQFDPHLWHNGGGMFFGDDGFLYLTNGDGGGANDDFNNSQRIDSGLFSGMLRIDVNQDAAKSHPIRRHPQSADPTQPSFSGNYFIPNDNPFLDPNGGVLEEFWAIGFRNPHRATFDPLTRQIWEGDVGETTREEIDLVEKGGNYQWAYKEGLADGPKPRPAAQIGNDQPPLLDYPHADGNNCVIGGYVYRGTQFADLLDGKYIFGDNGSGLIWALNYGGGATTLTALASMPAFSLTSFGIDQNSEIFLCKLGTTQGGIFKLARAPDNVPAPPALLSQTGVFADLATLTPASGLIPYGVNTPLWSDGAQKRRWIAVPNDANQTVAFAPTGEWAFPDGTVFVKHFELPVDETNPAATRRLETRLLVRDANGGVYGLTYKWRADNSDAELLSGGLSEDIAIRTASGGTRTQTWYYPSRQACLVCHSANANYVLGVKTRQLNGNLTYPSTGVTDNQLRAWNHVGLFSPALNESDIAGYDQLAAVNDPSATLERRVRSYLDANCAQCHRPGSGVRAYFDARYDTPLSAQGIVDGMVANSLGVAGAHIVTPGDTASSVLFLRVNTTDHIKMPPLARNVIDPDGVATLQQWISSLGAPESPPPAWTDRDIGDVAAAGDMSYANGTFTLRGSGADIWDTADAFHFAYCAWNGDGEIVARVTGLDDTDSWAKVGVMFRETLDAGSRHAFMLVTPNAMTGLESRATTGGTSDLSAGPYAAPPTWLRLVRSGSTFTGYQSDDGVTWQLAGTATIDMAANLYVGLAVTSHRDGTLCAATFDRVSTTAPAPAWQSQDIGAIGVAGGGNQNGSTFNLSASGDDIWGTDDSFRFAFRTLAGDGSIYARVTALDDTSAWAKAGVMFRESLASDAREAMMLVTPEGHAGLQYRATSGGGCAFTEANFAGVPMWLKLTRAGSTFSGYASGDGVNWAPVGSTTLDLPTTVYVGLALTSHNNTTLCNATFEQVAVIGATDPPPPSPLAAPSGLAATTISSVEIDLVWDDNSADETGFAIERSLDATSFAQIATVAANTTSYADRGLSAGTTYYYRVRATRSSDASPYSNIASARTFSFLLGTWSRADVGDVGVAGFDGASGASMTVTGSGADIWDTADGFHFLFQAWHGDGEMRVRVDSQDDTDAWAKAGVMFRENLTAGARNAFVCVTPRNGIGLQTRVAPEAPTNFSAGRWWGAAPYWVRLVRSGDTFTAYSSPDGTDWSLIDTQTVSMAVDIYVGFAVTAHNNSTTSTAAFSGWSLQ